MPQPQVPGYTVVGVVGRGGFAVVYRAVQVSVDREVAVKIDSRVVLDENDRRRFLREARAAGRLSGHPNVVDLYDAGVLPDGRPYLVMELCTGGSLLDRLRDGGALPVDEACALAVKMADALSAAHTAGVLHRDIKPANILVNRYGVYGLADFGLAALAEPGRESSASLTALTPAYAAPEAFRQEPPTERADIYALGATLYALLSGRPPRFPRRGEPNLTEIIRMHDQPLPGIVGVPDDVMAVLHKALAADPSDRFASAAEFRDALAAADTTPATTAEADTGEPTADEVPDDDTAEAAPDDDTGAAPDEGTGAAADDDTEAVSHEPPAGPTKSFGFGPRRDEEPTLGRVEPPDPAEAVTTHVHDEPADRRGRGARSRFAAARRGVVALAAALVLVAAGVTWVVLSDIEDGVQTGRVLDVPGGPDAADGATDILLVGNDSRTDTEGRPLPDDVLKQLRTEQKSGSATDTLVLIRVPDEGGRASAVSIPRDVRVPIPDAGDGPINTAYGVTKQRAETGLRGQGVTDERRLARESDDAGRKVLVQVVQQLTGIRVDRYAELNLYGFYLISEVIGGVDVCLKADTADSDSGASFTAGRQSISGGDALSFVRQRRGLPRGELDRIVRQQVFMQGLADKLLSTGTLTDPATVSRLTDTLRRTVVIDADWDVLDFVRRMQELAAGDVEFVTAPARVMPDGTTAADPAGIRAFVTGLVSGTPSTSATAAAADPNSGGPSPVNFVRHEPLCVN
ncbi:protein kinase domain-containing protein [Saccharothrix variisporea]|uniref:LytR family transcriptional attenuator n=1 Tax=Saccharothrix variisporea TaxID=543527 RepID=A0A495XME2_9PSEU|nr:LCP family protein [Saccharothrix variisporea]RKT74086.1 LytR family transcriptional attenuator [Saccharothrix variisporea]